MYLFLLAVVPFLIINAGELRITGAYAFKQVDWREVRRTTGDARDAWMDVDPTESAIGTDPTSVPDQRDLPVQLRVLENVSLMDHPGNPEIGKEAVDMTARDRFSVEGKRFSIIGVWGPPPYQPNQSYIQIRTQDGREGWVFRRDIPYTDDELHKVVTEGLKTTDASGQPVTPTIFQHKPQG